MARTVVIVGASDDRRSFGNKAVRAHLLTGWTVYPVHPRAAEVEGVPVFQSIEDLPEGPIDRVTFYVRPEIGIGMLPEIARRNPAELLFNPGTSSPPMLAKAEELGLKVRQGCSIIAEGFSPAQFSES